MSLSDAQDIFLIMLCHMIALALAIGTNVNLIHKTQKSELLKKYLILQGCLVLWIVCKMIKTIAPTENIRWAAIVIQYIGVSFMGVCFLNFSFYLVFRKRLWKSLLIILYILAAIVCIIVATNPLHFLFYSEYDFYGDTFGPLFYAHALISYLLIFSTIFVLIIGMFQNRKSKQEFLLTAAALIPLLFNILYVIGIIEPIFDYTPIALSITLFILSRSAFHYKFFGVLPMAYKTLVNGLTNSNVIVNKSGKVLYGDTKFSSFIHQKKTNFKESGSEYKVIDISKKRNKRCYHLSDITRIMNLQNKQEDNNETLKALTHEIKRSNAQKMNLVISETMNHTRHDLHDLLGHSLTQIILLLESTKILLRTDTGKASTVISQTHNLTEDCIYEIETLHQTNLNKSPLFSESLHEITESFSETNISINLTIKGKEFFLPKSLTLVLTRACQESVTNSVKHGKADEVEIAVLFKENELILIIADNGEGCDSIVPGQGLRMMADRLGDERATFKYTSRKDEGFLISIGYKQ